MTRKTVERLIEINQNLYVEFDALNRIDKSWFSGNDANAKLKRKKVQRIAKKLESVRGDISELIMQLPI